ncbi:MAG: electron transport complex subunit RsxC [Thermodesulfobacteriota bacterium]
MLAFLFQNPIPGPGTFPRGVHPPTRKTLTCGTAVEVLPTPDTIVLPLQQHIGAPCEMIVKARQTVTYGQMVARSDALISASLHAPVSGKIAKPVAVTLPNGRHMMAVVIQPEGEQPGGRELLEDMFSADWPTTIGADPPPDAISRMIREAGIVGLGGAAFPTHVKIAPNERKPVNALLVNGCECEPYLTADDRLMQEFPAPIVTGALYAARSIGAERIYVCIESNKPAAVEALRRAAAGTGIIVAVLKTKYPQGSERHLIKAVTDRVIPLGGLPADVGVAVSNVGTMAAVARAVVKGRPLTHRIVCVTGRGIRHPKNLLVPVGARYRDLIEYCGGLTKDAARLVSGGPMMGFAFTDQDMPITKGTGGLTVLTREDIKRREETACIRCGRCVDVCPMHLVPAKLAQAAKNKDIGLAEQYNIMGCMESGCCGYVCPANIPLVQFIRMGKAMVMAEKRK